MGNNQITKVVAWYEHTIVLKNGTAWVFGNNDVKNFLFFFF